MTVGDLVERFLAFTRDNRKLSTLRHYSGRLKRLVELLGDRDAAGLKPGDLDDYLVQAGRKADGSPQAPDTRRANVVVLQTLWRWALQREHVDRDIAAKLEKPSGRKRERIPTAEEDAKIDALAKPAFRLIFRALRQTGARPGELCRATIADFDREAKLIVLADHKTATKVGRPRKIGVGEKFGALLAEAIGERTAGPIFLDGKGAAWTPAKLSRTYLYLKNKAGLPRELCLYLQRHAHATALCAKAGIFVAAQALGHASTKTTERYLHPDDSALGRNQDLV